MHNTSMTFLNGVYNYVRTLHKILYYSFLDQCRSYLSDKTLFQQSTATGEVPVQNISRLTCLTCLACLTSLTGRQMRSGKNFPSFAK